MQATSFLKLLCISTLMHMHFFLGKRSDVRTHTVGCKTFIVFGVCACEWFFESANCCVRGVGTT